jgi:hypothetical protein
MGWVADAAGIDAESLLRDGVPAQTRAKLPAPRNVGEWLRLAQADVLFEATSLSPRDGQPAIDHIRIGLEARAHCITANKVRSFTATKN